MNKDAYIAWLRQRITFCRDRLNLVEIAFAEELAKPVRRRQRALLVFLDKERSVYLFAVTELEGALLRIDNG